MDTEVEEGENNTEAMKAYNAWGANRHDIIREMVVRGEREPEGKTTVRSCSGGWKVVCVWKWCPNVEYA